MLTRKIRGLISAVLIICVALTFSSVSAFGDDEVEYNSYDNPNRSFENAEALELGIRKNVTFDDSYERQLTISIPQDGIYRLYVSCSEEDDPNSYIWTGIYETEENAMNSENVMESIAGQVNYDNPDDYQEFEFKAGTYYMLVQSLNRFDVSLELITEEVYDTGEDDYSEELLYSIEDVENTKHILKLDSLENVPFSENISDVFYKINISNAGMYRLFIYSPYNNDSNNDFWTGLYATPEDLAYGKNLIDSENGLTNYDNSKTDYSDFDLEKGTYYLNAQCFNSVRPDLNLLFVRTDGKGISYKSIKKATVTELVSKKVYTGKDIKQTGSKVKLSGKKLEEGRDYIVTYKNNKNVGKATLTIKGVGTYTGKLTKTFKIIPKTVKLSSLSRAKRGFTVKWKKLSKKMSKSRITGYQVQIATNKSFTKNKKSKRIKGYNKTSYKFTGLKAKKTYYVRIRTYMVVGDNTYYSNWSTVKNVKTK